MSVPAMYTFQVPTSVSAAGNVNVHTPIEPFVIVASGVVYDVNVPDGDRVRTRMSPGSVRTAATRNVAVTDGWVPSSTVRSQALTVRMLVPAPGAVGFVDGRSLTATKSGSSITRSSSSKEGRR